MSSSTNDYACVTEDSDLFLNSCRWINISEQQPQEFAVPLYGYFSPVITAATVFTNTFIVVVLSHRHLRTPTNFVLLAMAITELLTGLTSAPWLLYYYTFQGYEQDRKFGLSDFWCKYHRRFSNNLPTICHTSAIWLTVYLATQRYVYICMPRSVHRYCTRSKTFIIIMVICCLGCLSEMPEMLAVYSYPIKPSNSVALAMNWSHELNLCIVHHYDWIDRIGTDNFYSAVFWFKAVGVHTVPCILLIIFSLKLIIAIRESDRRRLSITTGQQPNPNGRRSTATNLLRTLHSTTRMLVVVIAIFLVIEIPVAAIFVLHFLMVIYKLLPRHFYHWMNVAIIFRNVCIILTYPFNFAIYCGMSEQFRITVRQLFSRQVLYVTRPSTTYYNGVPRYSYQLVSMRSVNRRARHDTGQQRTDHLNLLILNEISQSNENSPTQSTNVQYNLRCGSPRAPSFTADTKTTHLS